MQTSHTSQVHKPPLDQSPSNTWNDSLTSQNFLNYSSCNKTLCISLLQKLNFRTQIAILRERGSLFLFQVPPRKSPSTSVLRTGLLIATDPYGHRLPRHCTRKQGEQYLELSLCGQTRADSSLRIHYWQDRRCTYDVTSKRFRENILAMEKQ